MKSKVLNGLVGAIALFGISSFAGGAHAVVVTGQLYNTGVASDGSALAAGNGQADGNYFLDPGGPAGVTYYNPAYATESATSRWISVDGSGGLGGQTVTFSTT